MAPVFIQGAIDPFLALLTFGQIQINWGWDTSVPAASKVFVVHQGDPNQAMRMETPITGANVVNTPLHTGVSHGDLGLMPSVLRELLLAARGDNVPVRDPDLFNLVVQNGRAVL